MSDCYKIVQLPNGTHAIYSSAYDETMHPGLGPVGEAENLHIAQLKIRERLRNHVGEFVVWDVGLGAAANALTLLRQTRDSACPLRIVSFDDTVEPLSFALHHTDKLEYLRGYEHAAKSLLENHCAAIVDEKHSVHWNLHIADFPSLIVGNKADLIPKPHAIMFDAFSPAKNPAMWTLPLFSNIFRLLDSSRPCALTTYSRSTMVRSALLLAGFFVGRGHPTGLKEETTVAANNLDLLDEPLDKDWLLRAQKSHSAEPLTGTVYAQLPLSRGHLSKLLEHPQFK